MILLELNQRSIKMPLEDRDGSWQITGCENDSEIKTLDDAKVLAGRSWGQHVFGDFQCNTLKNLRSLKGAPEKVDGNFWCFFNKNLSDLRGGPKEVGKNYYAHECGLETFEGVATKIKGGLTLYGNNKLKSLSGIGKYFKGGYIKGHLIVPGSIDEALAGVLLIEQLQDIDFDITAKGSDLELACEVINRHLKGERKLPACQKELIKLGLDRYAKL